MFLEKWKLVVSLVAVCGYAGEGSVATEWVETIQLATV
jgi:hypothetical protein